MDYTETLIYGLVDECTGLDAHGITAVVRRGLAGIDVGQIRQELEALFEHYGDEIATSTHALAKTLGGMRKSLHLGYKGLVNIATVFVAWKVGADPIPTVVEAQPRQETRKNDEPA